MNTDTPPRLAPVRSRAVLRQARVLRALRGTGVPVSEVLFESPGSPPAEPPLFVMDLVDGSSIEPLFDVEPGSVDAPEVVADRLGHGARVLAALHSVEPSMVGLGAETPTELADEVGRWTALLRTVDPTLVAGWETVAESLLARLPRPLAPRIVHGDFRLGNTLAAGSRITAVIDWEIWSVGDPRLDLGWFLVNADPATYGRTTPYVGLLPGPDELAEIYTAELDAEVTDVGWFRALACFKSAASWSLIVKHNRRRPDPDPRAEEMAPLLPRLLALAQL